MIGQYILKGLTAFVCFASALYLFGLAIIVDHIYYGKPLYADALMPIEFWFLLGVSVLSLTLSLIYLTIFVKDFARIVRRLEVREK